MIKNEMFCEFCGKKFYTEYYDCGYIDHYMNFASPERHKFIGSNAAYAVDEIAKKGNDYRSPYYIKERLNCFLKWPDVSDDVKAETKRRCEFLIDKMHKAQGKAEQIVSGMTSLERKFLIDEAEYNYGKPFGNEDGKIWEGYEE